MNILKLNHSEVKKSIVLNRTLYVAFVILGLYFVIFGSDFSTGVSNFGIALTFDPFDQRVNWTHRPRYQRIWLFVHIGLLLSALVCLVLFKLL